MIGLYYLHVNGDIIYRMGTALSSGDLKELGESDLVKKYWIIPDAAPADTKEGCEEWIINWLREAVKLSGFSQRTLKRAKEILKAQGIDEERL